MHASKFRRRALRAGVLVAAVDAALIAASTASATTYTWNVSMSGQQQIASHLPGDPDGTGSATITGNTVTNTMCGQFSWQNVAAPVGFGHIHEARYGQPENPGFTINLFGPPTNLNGFPSGTTGCTTVPGVVIEQIASKPSFFMATIHNVAYPGGAIRGQLGQASSSITCDLRLSSLCPGP
jgi:hypothetical protein